MRTRIARWLHDLAYHLERHARGPNITWEELMSRDAHGHRVKAGDRVRWIGWRDGMTPERNPRPGATGYAKTARPGHVWFWLDEPTGEGPCGEYWDVAPHNLERI